MKLTKIIFILVSIIIAFFALIYISMTWEGFEVKRPIWQAIRKNRIEYVRRYLNEGGDPNWARDLKWLEGPAEQNFTLLMEATREGNLDITNLLLENGADPNAETSKNRTALLLAVKNGNLQMVELLVKNGADINYGSSAMPAGQACFNARDVLCEAISGDHVDVVDFLVKHGANVQKGHLEHAEGMLQWSRPGMTFEKEDRVKRYEAIIAILKKHLH